MNTGDTPSVKAVVPPETSPIVGALLRSVSEMDDWPRIARLCKLESYYRGQQYDDRKYYWDGSDASQQHPMGLPYFPPFRVPLRARKPPADLRIARKITRDLTSTCFAGHEFPEIHVDGDPITEDWARAVAKVADFSQKWRAARNLGGSMSEVCVSWAVVQGSPRIEVHSARLCHVLDWDDREQGRPAVIVKVWETEEMAMMSDGTLQPTTCWYAREWRAPRFEKVTNKLLEMGIHRLYRWFPRESAEKPERWELVEANDIPECTCIVVRNSDDGDFGSEGDYEGSEGTIDEANIILGGTSTGTALNADPTLVIHTDAANVGSTDVKKGGFNTIFSEKGADYLQMKSDGVKAGLDNTKFLKQTALDASNVTDNDPEKMSRAAQSGEAIRRLRQPMTTYCDTLRKQYGDAIVRVLQGLWRMALWAATQTVTVPFYGLDGKAEVEPDGTPRMVTYQQAMILPPRIEKEPGPDGKEKVTKVVERQPGGGGEIRLVWPDYEPLSEDEKLKMTQRLVASVGQRPIAQLKTAIEEAKSRGLLPIDDAEEEAQAIVDNTATMAEAEAGPMGMREPDENAPPPPGAK